MPKETYRIIQWNCQGIQRKKGELLQLIEDEHPLVIAVQETMITMENNFRLPHYNIVKKAGKFNRRPHGGVALFVHESVPSHNEIVLRTDLQAVAVEIFLHRKITVCSLYSPRSSNLNEELLTDLLRQLPSPVIIMGDFNAYHRVWGNATVDARGRQVLSFTQNNSLNIANDGEPTRTTQHSETVIDLTIVSPTLEPELEWKIFNSPLDSDHNPIIISVKRSFRNDSTSIRTNIKRANWEVYRNSVAWKDLPPRVDLVDDKEIMRDLYARFEQASNDAIPMIPKPWWSAECLVSL